MALKKVSKTVQTFPVPDLTGGYSTSQAQDNECQIFENVDIGRNQWVTSRAGTTIVHDPGAINSWPISGIANCGVGGGNNAASPGGVYIVIAKQNYTFYAHKPQVGWMPGERVVFTPFTVPYDCGAAAVGFESMTVVL